MDVTHAAEQQQRRPGALAPGCLMPSLRDSPDTRTSLRRHGLTLLEVILALAILSLSMVAIGELIRIGTHSARDAQDMTQAQILCESKLSELVAGVAPYEPAVRAPLPMDPDWYYTVQLEPTEEEGVMALAVTVETHIERRQPIACTLVRWVPDPGLELPAAPEETSEEATEDESTTSDNNQPDENENGAPGFGA